MELPPNADVVSTSFCTFRRHQIIRIGCSLAALSSRHASKFDNFAGVKAVEEDEDVNAHFSRLDMESRLAYLEDRVASIEKKKEGRHESDVNCGLSCVVLISICVTRT
ncbi:hypothetical protein PIB30_054605 [Stylosanthes scabra]|uniref:Uncharacterized protein n=1 Tax=Stylosanthes scabra TaxID=79078 RepID=A0ABU6RIY6_9FABA|nr:hypothetical protein [Stylosanthes scabra]